MVWIWLSACLFLVIVSACDLKQRRIPNKYVILLALLGILRYALSYVTDIPALTAADMALGALCGALPLLLTDLLTRLMFKREGMGLGDVKLMAACGLLLGWKLALLAVAASVLLGGLAGAVLLLAGKAERGTYIAFGPFLSAGVLCSGLFGGVFLRWFFS